MHLKLNICLRPIANKYHEGRVKRTLERELKVPELAEGKANGSSAYRQDCSALGGLLFANNVKVLAFADMTCCAVSLALDVCTCLLLGSPGCHASLPAGSSCVSSMYSFANSPMHLCLRRRCLHRLSGDHRLVLCHQAVCGACVLHNLCCRRHFSIRPVLKHGPRSLTCVQVNWL